MPRKSKYFFSNSCSDLVTENCHFSKNDPYITNMTKNSEEFFLTGSQKVKTADFLALI